MFDLWRVRIVWHKTESQQHTPLTQIIDTVALSSQIVIQPTNYSLLSFPKKISIWEGISPSSGWELVLVLLPAPPNNDFISFLYALCYFVFPPSAHFNINILLYYEINGQLYLFWLLFLLYDPPQIMPRLYMIYSYLFRVISRFPHSRRHTSRKKCDKIGGKHEEKETVLVSSDWPSESVQTALLLNSLASPP